MIPNLNVVPLIDLPIHPAAQQAYLIAADPGLKKAVRVYLPDVVAAASVVAAEIGPMLAAASASVNAQVNALSSSINLSLVEMRSEVAEVVADTEMQSAALLAGLGYMVPVPYTAGIQVESGRFTVSYAGVTYAPVQSALPFVTSETLDIEKWRMIQGVSGADLASSSGSAMVGFRQASPSATLRTTLEKMREWVSPEDFGAIGDGTARPLSERFPTLAEAQQVYPFVTSLSQGIDYAAIQAAVSVPSRCVHFLPKTYVCGDIVPANGVHLLGFAGHGYTDDEPHFRPRLLKSEGSSCLMNVVGTRGVTASGMVFDGLDGTVPVVSSGSSRFTAENCRFTRGSVGFGGYVGSGSLYSRTSHFIKCVFSSCGTGIQNLIDSFLTECEVAANLDINVYGSSGADSNTFTACRFEWSANGRNLRLAGASGSRVSSYKFVACTFDRGAVGSVYMGYVKQIQFVGCDFKRGNRGGGQSASANCNVYVENGDFVSFTDCMQSAGRDDEPQPMDPMTPAYAYHSVSAALIFQSSAVEFLLSLPGAHCGAQIRFPV
ncbi:hypothetical protein [Stenotrophomonas lacuserhaii]|uniref:hypothetical protein n=1 Tax=Stenotrophomonas lacuserhaii TaxID=2760084 RepID=UPI0015FD000A|nr:hypothetical protein [Stenotrophomonas lacuserhaii]